MNITELRAYVASNDYGAELALQHAMRLLGGMEQERALADRLAALLQRDRDGYGGQEVDADCDCCDCEYLGPIDDALAAWKEARKQSTASVVQTNSAETTQDVETRR